jgi:hypothetical protein
MNSPKIKYASYDVVGYPDDTKLEIIQDPKSGNYLLLIGHLASKGDVKRFLESFLEELV